MCSVKKRDDERSLMRTRRGTTLLRQAPPGDETEISGNVAKGADSGLREATPTSPHSLRDTWVPPLLRLARCECRDEAFTPDERVCFRRAEGRPREKEAGAAVPRIVVTSRVIINCAC
ncbi:PREDICTED: uncharacterized protein LOC108768694 [Trachymyrmex cornetzi]|uniref:uncharacterized protein LOC108768694 n=1 Tax=Trachymyrmex cornetzi TaxID=471704 RepID=UPI00084F4B33|nr:PREDICTED: uncharacterized protein LOC108768694 [Trachymyrmex cornetzi]